ncbi:hypothetical protein E3N88_27318 [Mikania micrantha]|uniref:Uncharacterized protein n=1 Tax=Mikania micrantha TaxID=192012 RepID=A0A5N6MXC0_9ASTR|nr:hypothetical protein E3N88_27318 [Mikania micrantha]
MKSGEHKFITISIEGVEFHPLDFENEENKLDMQSISTYSDNDWGKRLPDDYTYIVKWSKDFDESMTRKEVYFLLRKGIFINNLQQWFSISKKSKKRVMLPARAILQEEKGWNFLSLPGSRFKEVAESCDNNHLAIGFEIESELLSIGIMYACYLVFKLPENASGFEGIVLASFETRSRAHIPIEHHIYLVTPPHTPIIDERPSTTRKIKGHPKLRKDGWMEIQVYELYNGTISFHTISESGYLKSLNGWKFTGLLVQGIEFRPAKVSWSYSYSEVFEDAGKRMGFERMQRIADLAVTPLSYTTQSQLLFLFMKGMVVQDGKTWFSVNKKGHHSELISTQKCISTSDDTLFIAPIEFFNSRFEYLFKYTSNQDLRLEVKTQFLSPNVTYIISLVYRFEFPSRNDLRVPFKYKLEETGQYWTSCVARVGKDGWLRTELFQFTCTKNELDFDIHFSSEMKSGEHNFITISIEGVEFHPLDFETQKNKLDMRTITYSDMDWGKRLPDDYTYIVKWSKDIDESMTRKDVYFLLHKGIFINNSQQWFSISKKSKKRVMLPARAILQEEKGWNFLSLPGSRFKEVAESCDNNNLAIGFEVESELLSTGIMYACYLVFKLPENASGFEGIVLTSFETHIPIEHHIYLVTPPHLPIIDEIPSTTRKIKGHPKLRKDGWMEIQVYELYNGVIGYNTFSESGYLKSLNGWNFTGLLVQGLEFRPAKVSWSYSYSVRKY